MSFNLAICLSIFALQLQTSSCAPKSCESQTITKCKWTIDSNVLDLTPFQIMGTKLNHTDTQSYKYEFSPCNNLINNEWMVISQQQNVNYLAKFNGTIQPTIRNDTNSQIVWNFVYNEQFAVEYLCDYNKSNTSFMEIKQILEVYPNSYLMQISSQYLCNNTTFPNQLSINQCMWYDKTNTTLLDLRPLYGTTITAPYTASYYRTFKVCENAYYAKATNPTVESCCMIVYSGNPDNSPSAYWNPMLQPEFYSNNNSWLFPYSRYLSLQWVCDPKIDTYSVISGISPISIATKYACPKTCVFMSDDNVLDLSFLIGDLIRGTSDDYVFSIEYTVCNNDIKCDDENVMAMLWNVSARECDRNLATWNGFEGYDLTYDENLKQWRFSYYDGGLCPVDESNTIFVVYWRCNEDVSSWSVTKVEEINECEYSMYIDSALAC